MSKQATRRRILDRARAHFFAHGFRSVTMEDLAVELGMSKKTLYAHFRSKTALLQAVLRDKFGRVDRDLRRIVRDRRAGFAPALQRLLASIQEHAGEIQPPFVRDMRKENPGLFQLVEQRRRAIIKRHVGTLLVRGRRSRLIRKDLPPPLAIDVLLAAVQGVMHPAKVLELNLTPAAGYAAILRIFLEGMLTRRGRKLT